MYRDSYYEKIISLIKKEPRSQRQIWYSLNPVSGLLIKREENITIQGIANYLDKGINEGKIIYLGNKVPKKDAKCLLRYKFNKIWPFNAWRCYLYVPETEKFAERLRKKVNIELNIREIILLYSVLELSAMFQKIWYESPNILKRDFKSRGYNFSNKEIEERIVRSKEKVTSFYKSLDKEDSILEFLQLTPLMYWCAFKRPVPVEAKEYDASKDIVLIKDKLMNKLRDLIIQKNI